MSINIKILHKDVFIYFSIYIVTYIYISIISILYIIISIYIVVIYMNIIVTISHHNYANTAIVIFLICKLCNREIFIRKLYSYYVFEKPNDTIDNRR